MSNQVTRSPSFAARYAMLEAHKYAPANAALLGRAPADDMLAVLGKSSKGENSVYAFTESVNASIDAMKLDTTRLFDPQTSQKAIKRFIQFVHAINAFKYEEIDTTSAIIIYALQMSGGSPLTTDALQYIASGLKEGRISPESKGVSRQTVKKLFNGGVALGTIESQTSRTVGASGFLQLLGATHGEPKKVFRPVTIDIKHPLVIAFNDCMNKASDQNIDAMINKGKKQKA